MNNIALGSCVFADRGLSVTADASGAAIDVTDFDGAIAFLLSVNAISGTTPTLAVKLTESTTTGGTYTDVPNGAFSTGYTTVDGDSTLVLDAGQLKGFVKFAYDVSGTSPVYTVTAGAFGRKKYTP